MNARTVAREWLLLVVLIAVGLAVVPAALRATVFPELELGGFYGVLIDTEDDWWIAWAFVLAPYAIVQLGRSIVWAVQVIRSKPGQKL